MSDQLSRLPDNLPAPVDDGAADHLAGLEVPSIPLPATTGAWINLARLPGWSVVFCFPRTGRPEEGIPAGWDEIPGARGCTPQACSFRDHAAAFATLHTRIFGMSTQDTAYQQEAVQRLHLPYPLLSDHDLAFTRALNLPTFSFNGMTLLKRLPLFLHSGRIEHVIYPVFPPGQSAGEALRWLERAGVS